MLAFPKNYVVKQLIPLHFHVSSLVSQELISKESSISDVNF